MTFKHADTFYGYGYWECHSSAYAYYDILWSLEAVQRYARPRNETVVEGLKTTWMPMCCSLVSGKWKQHLSSASASYAVSLGPTLRPYFFIENYFTFEALIFQSTLLTIPCKLQ